MRGGITFLKTTNLADMTHFYVDDIGCTVWLRQPGVNVLRFGNQLIGLHETGAEADTGVLLTFFYPTRGEVDAMYAALSHLATCEPRYNEKYHIYQFFGRDPEGRGLEFQWFDHELPTVGDM
ncbi:MAG: VOC family protein [Armatimonadia bacterium]|nr:VOC family protein [Armatimonadia bacterium]